MNRIYALFTMHYGMGANLQSFAGLLRFRRLGWNQQFFLPNLQFVGIVDVIHREQNRHKELSVFFRDGDRIISLRHDINFA